MSQQADILLLSAGFGKRLGEMTKVKPKPLIEVGGKPIIEWNLEMIARSGFSRVLVNLHYFPEMLEDFLADGSKWGLSIECIREEPEILDTGGAIRNVESLLEHDTLMTVNSDVLLGKDFNLTEILSAHLSSTHQPIATMVLREDEEAERYGAIGIDADARVCSFLKERYQDCANEKRLMYLGVQALSRRAMEFMPKRGSVFSITQDTYPKMLAAGEYVHSYRYNGYWNDVGTPERLARAQADSSEI